MDIFNQILSIVVSLGIGSYITAKLIDRRNRFLDSRKEIYSKITESFSGFFSSENENLRQEKRKLFLEHFRQIQLWGSPEVVRAINGFLKAIDVHSNISQTEKDLNYKKVIIAMRNDLLKEKLWPRFLNKNQRDLNVQDINIYGSMS